MPILNIEFKAVTNDLTAAENLLLQLKPIFKGTDHQIDTYFNVPYGRLKLREGNVENALIHYQRENIAGSKLSHVLLHQPQPGSNLKSLLTGALGIKAVVDKQRKIYFIDNVKFHFDIVKNLGTFIEVEAISLNGNNNTADLQRQCDHYINLFRITNEDFVAMSYSDMILAH